jgi:tRNA(His) 5'-end guanylyltransferase
LNAGTLSFHENLAEVCQDNIFKVSILLELLCKITTVLTHTPEMLGAKDSVDDHFVELIDDLVVMSEKDSELAEGLRWIDVQSQRNGLTFYEMAMIILRKHMAERRAKEWLKGKLSR